MDAHIAIEEFWTLANAGKSVALDVNLETREFSVRYACTTTGEDAYGTPPRTMSEKWVRIVTSTGGLISHYPLSPLSIPHARRAFHAVGMC
jgi:hypothetical protein